jgi:hypothetical protein
MVNAIAIGPWSSTYHCGSVTTFPLPLEDGEGEPEDEDADAEAVGEDEPADDAPAAPVGEPVPVVVPAAPEPAPDGRCEAVPAADVLRRPLPSIAAAVAAPPPARSITPPAANSTRRRLGLRAPEPAREPTSPPARCGGIASRVAASSSPPSPEPPWRGMDASGPAGHAR